MSENQTSSKRGRGRAAESERVSNVTESQYPVPSEAAVDEAQRADGWVEMAVEQPPRMRFVHVESAERALAVAQCCADGEWRGMRGNPLGWTPVKWHAFPERSEG